LIYTHSLDGDEDELELVAFMSVPLILGIIV
jgi:hypothetical protein